MINKEQARDKTIVFEGKVGIGRVKEEKEGKGRGSNGIGEEGKCRW